MSRSIWGNNRCDTCNMCANCLKLKSRSGSETELDKLEVKMTVDKEDSVSCTCTSGINLSRGFLPPRQS